MKSNFNPWPYAVISFFVLLICTLITVIIIASTHRESMVSDNYYEQELKFQDQIDGSARAQKVGANIQLDASAGQLKVAVPAGQLAQKFSGVIVFYRPSSPDLDRELTLAPGTDGSQSVDISKMATGLWKVRVKWTAGGQSYFLEEKSRPLKMEFGIAIALGFVGSLHCAAMCGPLMLALPAVPGGPGRFIASRVIYQLGRVTTYCLLGTLAGLIGKSILLAGFQRWLSIALGITILSGFLISKKLALSAPVVSLVARLKTAMSTQLRQRGFRSLTLLGMLNGLLPCGLVYVAVAGAVSQGTLLRGIAFMALFGLGTVPTMLGIGLSGRVLPLAFRLKLRAAIPLGICLVAGLLILRGLALGIPYVSPAFAAGVPSCCAH